MRQLILCQVRSILSAGWVLLSVVGSAVAQVGDGVPPRDLAKEARRLVTFLELPARRRVASEGLLRMGRSAIPELVRGLRDPRLEVVGRVVQILRRLGPDAVDALPALRALAKDADDRLAFAARWGAHGIATRGATSLLDSGGGRILEIDGAGEVSVLLTETGIYDAERLENGNVLVGYISGWVHEVNAAGAAVRKHQVEGAAIDVDSLPNGHVLVATGKGKQVVEIDRYGKVVWKFASPWPNDADRLPSGNTLISDYRARKIVEVDPTGKVVWSVATPKGTIDVERLNNGNTLVVLNDSKVVAEIDPTGKTVRTIKAVKIPKCAVRLPNGGTVIGGKNEIVEVDMTGKVVWRAKAKGGASWGTISTVHRF